MKFILKFILISKYSIFFGLKIFIIFFSKKVSNITESSIMKLNNVENFCY